MFESAKSASFVPTDCGQSALLFEIPEAALEDVELRGGGIITRQVSRRPVVVTPETTATSRF